MWLPGAGDGGEDLSAMGAKNRIHHEGTKDTKGLEITD
jgi:hypothetical protein